MGLNTSHGCFDGPYSSFHSFRIRLAQKIGIDLMEMEGFTANGKSWENVDSKLVPLLYHSDCDGILTLEECKLIAEGLTEILDTLPEPDVNDGMPSRYSFKERVKQFRDGCLYAIKKKEHVVFG